MQVSNWEKITKTKNFPPILEIIDWWKTIGNKLTLDQINQYKLENKNI